MKHIVSIGEAAALLGVCTKTIRRWDTNGKIKCFRTLGGHRRITLIEIKRVVQGLPSETKIDSPAIYCRVSSHEQKQKGDYADRLDDGSLECCDDCGTPLNSHDHCPRCDY